MIKEKIKTIGKYNFKKEEYFPVMVETSRYDSPDYLFSLFFYRKIKTNFIFFNV